jgi:hypothetical protein
MQVRRTEYELRTLYHKSASFWSSRQSEGGVCHGITSKPASVSYSCLPLSAQNSKPFLSQDLVSFLTGDLPSRVKSLAGFTRVL